ncbi:MAG: hypothetical protein OHK0029_28190 [Armatimonadaceae bacterium]
MGRWLGYPQLSSPDTERKIIYTMLLQRKKEHTAYTMIEMLIVLVIISLTAAILFVAFAPSREKAKESACIANLKQLYLVTMMYRDDHDGIEPVVGRHLQHTQTGLPYEGEHLANFVNRYVKDLSLVTCPIEKQDNETYTMCFGKDIKLKDHKPNSEVWYKMGQRSPLWMCDKHNPPMNPAEVPRWTTRRVLVLRFDGSVDTVIAPRVGGYPYESID